MIAFVNAKLNLGLNVVSRRPDGYHDLETLFYPVGLHNGTPDNPEPFCDIIEITPAQNTVFHFSGRPVACELEKNLIYKAWCLFKERYPALGEYSISLEKHIPDGAGLGGGSADASFVLKMLNELSASPFSKQDLADMALLLGADCPFFIYNEPCFAKGVGELLTPAEHIDLSGWWCALVKPDVYVSTREAFAGIVPSEPEHVLADSLERPVEEWTGIVVNDFEKSVFPIHPVLSQIKNTLLENGAHYAAMSGSGSTIFGLFRSKDKAAASLAGFGNCFTTLCML